jgi:hypothetical protein
MRKSTGYDWDQSYFAGWSRENSYWYEYSYAKISRSEEIISLILKHQDIEL